MNLKLDDTNITLFFAIGILISLIAICHLSNYLYPKEKFLNTCLYSNPVNTKYTNINYYALPKGICDNIIENANIPCPTTESSKTKSCGKPSPTESCQITKTELTPEQLTTLYRYLYERSGLEIMKRVIGAETIV